MMGQARKRGGAKAGKAKRMARIARTAHALPEKGTGLGYSIWKERMPSQGKYFLQ